MCMYILQIYTPYKYSLFYIISSRSSQSHDSAAFIAAAVHMYVIVYITGAAKTWNV